MNKRERIINALNHKETDFIPYSISFTGEEYQKVADYLDDPEFVHKIGNHIDQTEFNGFLKEINPGIYQDDFGVVWNRKNGRDKDIGVVEGIVIGAPDMKQYQFPEIREEKLKEQYEVLINNSHDTFKIAGIGFSMFERAWTLRGMENLLSDMLLNPDFVHEFLDAICEFNLKIIDLALDYDFDGIYFGDDWGQQQGLIMGPVLWRKFIKPKIARMYARVKESDKYILQHSCGDIHEIFPDLIDIGLDVYQTFQPEIYDIKEVKKEFGPYLSFWGGISTQRLLPFATREELEERIPEIMKIVGQDGGYIAAPTHAIPGDVPPENVVTMIEIFQNQQKFL